MYPHIYHTKPNTKKRYKTQEREREREKEDNFLDLLKRYTTGTVCCYTSTSNHYSDKFKYDLKLYLHCSHAHPVYEEDNKLHLVYKHRMLK